MTIHQSGVTIKRAAQILNISEAAVRQRLLRRTLSSTRQNGRVFVLLPEDFDVVPPDDPSSRSDNTADDTIGDTDDTSSSPLVAQLRSENALLREQLTIKDRQISELHVMLQTTQRQLSASVPVAPHVPERPAEDESHAFEGKTPQRAAGAGFEASAHEHAEKPLKRRSWLGRFFFGE